MAFQDFFFPAGSEQAISYFTVSRCFKTGIIVVPDDLSKSRLAAECFFFSGSRVSFYLAVTELHYRGRNIIC